MSFNVTGYMKDIDLEIEKHRQEIAKHRLWISQLEDTRLMLQQREEMRAATNGMASPFGTLPDTHVIAVRDMEAGVLSHAAKTGQLPAPTDDEKRERLLAQKRKWRATYRAKKAALAGALPGLNASGNRRGMNNKSRGPRPLGVHTQRKAQLTVLFKANPQSLFSVGAVMQRIGMVLPDKQDKQALYQCLHMLKQDGVIHCPNGPGSYIFGPPPPSPS